MKNLVELIQSLFSENELRRFVAFHLPQLRPHLPSGGSLADLAFALVEQVERRGLLDDLWTSLLEERPHRSDDIQRVRAQWETGNTPRSTVFEHLDNVGPVFRALLEANLVSDEAIDAMLAGVDKAWVTANDPHTEPRARLTTLLSELNGVRQLPSGQVPLKSFLGNAVNLAYDKPGAPAIEALYERVARASETTPDAPAGASALDEQLQGQLELKMGARNEMLPIEYLIAGARAATSVARILVPRHQGGVKILGTGNTEVLEMGTGWLIAPGLLITNHHVVNARPEGGSASEADFAAQARSTRAQFDYLKDAPYTEVDVVDLVLVDKDRDFALLRLGEGAADRAPLVLRKQAILKPADGTLSQRVNVLQHPDGGPMQLGFRDNFVVKGTSEWLSYLTDTLGGSSGSPVCDDSWAVAALHRGWRRLEHVPVKLHGRTIRAENYGIPIPRILDFLRAEHEAIFEEIQTAQG